MELMLLLYAIEDRALIPRNMLNTMRYFYLEHEVLVFYLKLFFL